jgi:hypothetical protein
MNIGDRVMITDRDSAWYKDMGFIEDLKYNEYYPVYVRFDDGDWCMFKESEVGVFVQHRSQQ